MSGITTSDSSTTEALQQQLAELQQQLADSDNRLRSFLSLTNDAYCCLEFDPPVPTYLPVGEQAAMMLGAWVADCNMAFARLSGGDTIGELIGNRFVSVVNTTSDTLVERAKRLIRSGYRIDAVHNTEILLDGSVRHFINSSRGEIRNGELVRIWVTSRDVTFQTLIQAAVQEGRAEFNRTATQIDSAFWILDWDRFAMVYVGPQMEQRWGISQQRLLEDPLCWLERVHEHDRRRIRDAFLTHAATGTFDETFQVYLPDGSVGWVRNHCFLLPDPASQELRVVGMFLDVSESERARTGLVSLFRVSTELLFVMDADGNLQEVNDRMHEALGYDPNELRCFPFLDLLPPGEQSRGRQVLSTLASGKPAVEVQCHFLRKDGTELLVEWNAAPVDTDRRIYAAGRDISVDVKDHERRKLQNEAAASLDRLSPRERQVLEMIVEGKANKMIARELDLSQRTVETHRANLMKKLGLSTTAELVRLSLQAED